MEGVERRFVGPFENVEAPDFDMLGIEERADEPGKPLKTYLVGYAAVFGQDSVLLGDFVERIEPSAFDIVKAGKDKKGKPLQTRGLFNHDPNHLLGRYPSTMQMWVDDKGLKYSILLPESRRDIAEMVRRGDLRGSSFSFIVAPGGEKWHYESGQSIRTVTAIKALVDCGPVTYPAYEASSVAVAQRSLQVFKSNGGERELRREAARASIMDEVEKTRRWLMERRDCGQESDGKFGKGNTCASGASSPGPKRIERTTGGTSIKKVAKTVAAGTTTGGIIGGAIAGAHAFGTGAIDAAAAAGAASGGVAGSFSGAAKAAGSAISGGVAAGAAAGAAGLGGLIAGGQIGKWISPHTKQNHLIGILAAAAGGAIGGIPGMAIGAAASGIGQALYGRYREHTEAKLAEAKKGLSVTEAKVSKAKGVLDPGNEDFVQKSFADGHVMLAGPSGEVHVFKANGDSKAHVNFDADSGLGAEDAVRLAKGLGAKYVFHETKSKDAIPGFTRVQETPLVRGNTVHVKNLKSLAKRCDELVQFMAERRSAGDCGRGADGKFGSGNTCQGASGDRQPERGEGDSKYMEWKPGQDHKLPGKAEKAQEFIDRAREGQTISAGKDGGKSDDGGGVQTWSKGDHFPWVVKQVGDHDGHLQGVHPDGSQTAKYPFYGGDTSHAQKQVSDEISKRKKSK